MKKRLHVYMMALGNDVLLALGHPSGTYLYVKQIFPSGLTVKITVGLEGKAKDCVDLIDLGEL